MLRTDSQLHCASSWRASIGSMVELSIAGLHVLTILRMHAAAQFSSERPISDDLPLGRDTCRHPCECAAEVRSIDFVSWPPPVSLPPLTLTHATASLGLETSSGLYSQPGCRSLVTQ